MKYFLLFFLLASTTCLSAQNNIIDKIVAIVGEEIILKSDIEDMVTQLQQQGVTIQHGSDEQSNILEDLLVRKLLLAQSKIDSVFVTDEEVEQSLNSEINRRVKYFGSVERAESYMGKSMAEIRNEWRDLVKDQLITEKMQQKILEHVRVTPSEVRQHYRKYNKDSLPDEPARYEVQQIVIKPKISDVERERVRNQLREYRDQVISEEKTFSTLAMLHSQDEESALRGGDLGYISKSELVPEFADAAFALKPGRISKIVETEYGFHIIKYNDRQGERISVSHILLRARIEDEARQEAIAKLDTIVDFIKKEGLPFDIAAQMSDDKETRNNGGLLVNRNASTKLSIDELRPEVARQLGKLKVGEISEPFLDEDKDRHTEEYKIIKFKTFYPSHKANLEEDWMFFENELTNKKQQTALMKWVEERRGNTYIHIDDAYKSKTLEENGWIK